MLRVLALLIAAGLAVPAWGQQKTYYYMATAYDSAGIESDTTNEASSWVSPDDPSIALSWTLPTMRTDGSALTDLTGIRLYRSETSGACKAAKKASLPAGCVMAVDTQSATLKSYLDMPPVPSAPLPPLNLTVQAKSLTAYAVQLSHDALALLPVGIVPAGTACSSQSVTDRNGVTAYMIPSEVVQWAGSVKSGATFAQCSAG